MEPHPFTSITKDNALDYLLSNVEAGTIPPGVHEAIVGYVAMFPPAQVDAFAHRYPAAVDQVRKKRLQS